jgi:hypothetical protein
MSLQKIAESLGKDKLRPDMNFLGPITNKKPKSGLAKHLGDSMADGFVADLVTGGPVAVGVSQLSKQLGDTENYKDAVREHPYRKALFNMMLAYFSTKGILAVHDSIQNISKNTTSS